MLCVCMCEIEKHAVRVYVCAGVCEGVCMYVCMDVHVGVHEACGLVCWCMQACVYGCTCGCIGVCEWMYMGVCEGMLVYADVCVCVHVWVCVYGCTCVGGLVGVHTPLLIIWQRDCPCICIMSMVFPMDLWIALHIDKSSTLLSS